MNEVEWKKTALDGSQTDVAMLKLSRRIMIYRKLLNRAF